MKNKKSSVANTVISLVGLFLFLLGLFAVIRTGVNLVFFKKYPTVGVLSINLSGVPPYMQREEDCYYPQTYFTQDGKPREATETEKKNEQQQRTVCISGVTQSRESAKINDISTSLLFLFLGIGVIVGKKYIV